MTKKAVQMMISRKIGNMNSKSYEILEPLNKKTVFEHNGIKYLISTVDLTYGRQSVIEVFEAINEKRYETMIFAYTAWDSELNELGKCGYQEKHKTKQEAIERHEQILNEIENGNGDEFLRIEEW